MDLLKCSELLDWMCLQCNRLSRDCLVLSGREFQIWGPETAKARWPNAWSWNLRAIRSAREADHRADWMAQFHQILRHNTNHAVSNARLGLNVCSTYAHSDRVQTEQFHAILQTFSPDLPALALAFHPCLLHMLPLIPLLTSYPVSIMLLLSN